MKVEPVEMTEADVLKYRNRIFDTIKRGGYRGHFIVLFADRKSMFWMYQPGYEDDTSAPMIVTLIEQDNENLDDWHERVMDAEKEERSFFNSTSSYEARKGVEMPDPLVYDEPKKAKVVEPLTDEQKAVLLKAFDKHEFFQDLLEED